MNATIIKEDLEYIYWATGQARLILKYITFVIMPVGFFLNLVELLIFQKKKFKKTTMGFYFSINSAINMIIIAHLFVYALGVEIRIFFFLMSNIVCKMYSFFVRVFFQMSSWLNVIITADRLVFILFSNKLKFQSNKLILSLILSLFLVLILVTNFPNMFFYVDYINANSNQTGPPYTLKYCTASPLMLLIRNVQEIVMKTGLPFVLMFLINLYLLSKVRESQKKFKDSKYELRFSFTVMASSIIFLISLLPNIVWIILSNMFQSNKKMERRQTYAAFLSLLEVFSLLFSFINYSFNFLIHFAFNNIFRKEIFLILQKIIKIFNYKLKFDYLNSSLPSLKTNKSTH